MTYENIRIKDKVKKKRTKRKRDCCKGAILLLTNTQTILVWVFIYLFMFMFSILELFFITLDNRDDVIQHVFRSNNDQSHYTLYCSSSLSEISDSEIGLDKPPCH